MWSVRPACRRELLAHDPRIAGVLADTEVDVQAVGVVAKVQQHVPEGQAVLAAADGHQDLLVVAEHLVVARMARST